MQLREAREKPPDGKGLPPLPVAYSFVLRFGRDSDPASGRFNGQIEHLSSGRQGRFTSRQEMVSLLEQILTATRADPDAHEP